MKKNFLLELTLLKKLKLTMIICQRKRASVDADEVTGNKETESSNTDTVVYEDIAFWPRICSGQLLVDLVTLGPKMFQNKDEPCALTVRPEENSPRVMLHYWFYKTMANRKCFEIMVAVLKDDKIPDDRTTQIKSRKKSKPSHTCLPSFFRNGITPFVTPPEQAQTLRRVNHPVLATSWGWPASTHHKLHTQ